MELEQEIYDEAIIEITELANAVLAEFMNIESNKKQKIDSRQYDLILRQIHSIKGNSGMIGLDEQYKIVHQIETFLIGTYKEVGLTLGIVDLMIDFWNNFLDSLQTKPEERKSLGLYSACFDCLKKNNFKSVCGDHYNDEKSCAPLLSTGEGDPELLNIKKESTCESIVTVGSCTKVNELLLESGASFSKFTCINELYRKNTKLCEVSLVYIDLSSLSVNPFLLQHVFHFFKNEVDFIYLVDDKKDLSFFLEDIDALDFSFKVLPYKSNSFNTQISQQVKGVQKKSAA